MTLPGLVPVYSSMHMYIFSEHGHYLTLNILPSPRYIVVYIISKSFSHFGGNVMPYGILVPLAIAALLWSLYYYF